MSLLGWILFGALVGWLSSMVTGRRDGCLTSILVGIGGAVLGGFLYRLIGGHTQAGFGLESIIVAVLGAIVLNAILAAINNRSGGQ